MTTKPFVGIRSNSGVSEDSLRKYVPSLFAAEAHESRSDRYEFIPTWDVLKALQAKSFIIVSAEGARVRDEGRRAFCKHLVRLRLPGTEQVGDSTFEVVLRNAHDGTGAYNLMGGVFKFICSNGMVVGDHYLPPIKVQHRGSVSELVLAASHKVIDQAPMVMDTVRQWKGLELTKREQADFAAEAIKIRFEVDSLVNAPINVAQMVHARRQADLGNDLWSVFNRVQENCIRGGMEGRSMYRGRPTTRTVRAVRGIDQDLKINKQLWELGELMAQKKGVGL